jgi:S-adenosylmethionine-diacylglycerol 3-amino-3-carboxypropyl transferase
MHSEFYNVALDRLRYALVWESSRTLAAALDIRPDDEALIITSAGCNALNTLLLGARRVTAIDLNPVQNHLLELKRYLILHHEHGVLRALLGLEGPAAVLACWQQLEPTLPAELRGYWAPFFESHPSGILPAGKLESYLLGFLPTLSPALQRRLRRLVEFDSVAAQQLWFEQQLHGTAFEAQFVSYFDEANLSKGRDPRLFKYAAESGGRAFYQRLRRHLATELVRDNFFFRFFFFGSEGLPEQVLPPCYQARNFPLLRRRLDRLTVVQGDAAEYLLSPAGRRITKASLSNIFEYVSPAEFGRVRHALLHRPEAAPLRLVFWNLLQAQGDAAGPNAPEAPPLAQLPGACFYFRDLRVLDARRPTAAAHVTLPTAQVYA